MEEKWKPYQWGYEVSNLGRVKGTSGKLLTIDNKTTHSAVALTAPGGRRVRSRVASMVLQAFGHQRKNIWQVAGFRDGNPKNNQLGNLYWADPERRSVSYETVMKSGKIGERPSVMEFPVIDLRGVAPAHIQARVRAERVKPVRQSGITLPKIQAFSRKQASR